MKNNSRTYNTIANSTVGIISAIFNIFLNFFVRIAIVRFLGEEVNGLHSLFQNIVTIMTLVETSMCTAMIIHLYEPVKRKKIEELNNVLSFYQKLYIGIAFLFFIVSSIMNLFLEVFVKTSISMQSVHTYFLIFSFTIILNTITYVYRLILFAEQNNRISTMATLFSEIIFRGCAAIIAIYVKSYFLFLVCLMGEKLLGNLICRNYIKKTHPGIRCDIRKKTVDKEKQKIIITVKPLLISRIADIVQNSTQGILIGMLLENIAIVGYYGNYVLITGAVGIMYSQLGAAFTSSFGNLATEGNCKHMYKVYRKTDFIMSSFAIILFVGFVACIQDFIALVFGEQFLLNDISMGIIALNMFITLINIPIISVQNAIGKHELDSKSMLLQAILTVMLGYVGGSIWGIEGLLIGSIAPLFFFTTILKGVKIYNVVFEEKPYKLVVNITKHMFVGGVSCIISIIFTKFVDFELIILNILLKGATAIVVCIGVLGITMIKNEYFKELLMTLKKNKIKEYTE